MRLNKRWTTQNLLHEALASKPTSYEVNVGEETVECFINPATGYATWFHNQKVVDELSVANVLARWAVEGV